jgi:hypothetical protein
MALTPDWEISDFWTRSYHFNDCLIRYASPDALLRQKPRPHAGLEQGCPDNQVPVSKIEPDQTRSAAVVDRPIRRHGPSPHAERSIQAT